MTFDTKRPQVVQKKNKNKAETAEVNFFEEINKVGFLLVKMEKMDLVAQMGSVTQTDQQERKEHPIRYFKPGVLYMWK